MLDRLMVPCYNGKNPHGGLTPMKSKIFHKWIPSLILFVLLIVARLVSSVLPRLIWTWCEIVLFLCIAIYAALFPSTKAEDSEKEAHKDKKGPTIATLLLAFSMMLLSADSQYYCYADGYFPFLIPALILGILVGTGLSFLKRDKSDSTKAFVVSLISFCVISIFIMNILIIHLNYTLDFSSPQEYTVTIEDKHHIKRRKGKDTYKLELTVDGQTIKQEVDSDDYDAYEIGDDYSVQKYNGAFGKVFYLPAP